MKATLPGVNPYELLAEFEARHGDYYTLIDNYAAAKYKRKFNERQETARLLNLIHEHHELMAMCGHYGHAVALVARQPSLARGLFGERFEHGFDIQHCGVPAVLLGNMSLREAGAKETKLAYNCAKCRLKFTVIDDLPRPTPRMLGELDDTP